MSPADSRRVPQETLDSVVKALYADADRLDWEHLSPSRRTAQYDQWVTDAAIGVALADFMSAENARSWIKDGPMKEYGRARQGAGRYARFGVGQGTDPHQIVLHALGPDAQLIEGSVGVKPFHCLATRADGTTVYVTWGGAKHLRHLVWASLTKLAEDAVSEVSVVVTETMADPTTDAEKARHAAIARRCRIDLRYVRVGEPRRASVSELG